MGRLTTATLLLGAFALGAAVNEYRHTRLAASQAMPLPLAVNSPRPPMADAPPFTAPQSVPALDDPLGQVPAATSPSWDDIQRWVAAAELARALQALKNLVAEQPHNAEAWLLLAQLYQQQGNARESLAAWFTYLQIERDAARVEDAIAHVKRYLLQLAQNPGLFGEERLWLIAQMNALVRLTAEDGELHLALARLHLLGENSDEAQYHAIMAVNNPATQAQAEVLLGELNGEQMAQALATAIELPLIRYGNQFLVELRIDGLPAKLLLDTGASITGVTSQYVQRHPYLVKTRKPIHLNTASGKVETFLFKVDELTLGDLPFRAHTLAHLPMGDARDFDGLLGVDILGGFDFVIDQNNARLRLSKRTQ